VEEFETDPFLRPTEIIDWQHPEVLAQARVLGRGLTDPVAIARRCFEWVRDEIRHSRDYGLSPVTCKASDVLREGSGYCYAKSHLLAALLRANSLPAGLCYQRLTRDEGAPASFCLHGLNAVLLPGFGWYRADPRGNRPDINSQFVPPVEQLAFPVRDPGEADLPGIFADPLPSVVTVLTSYPSAEIVWQNLPDVEPVIRRFASADQVRLTEFIRMAFAELGYEFLPNGKHADIPRIEQAYADSHGAFYILELQGDIQGTVGVRQESERIGELKRLYIGQPCRGRGYGRRLCAAAIDAARSLGYSHLRLDTTFKSTAAIGLFKSLGFYEVARYNANPDAEIFMEKRL
jgi:N-acetylglutamate synthase-like GNAT family acetyltransferase